VFCLSCGCDNESRFSLSSESEKRDQKLIWSAIGISFWFFRLSLKVFRVFREIFCESHYGKIVGFRFPDVFSDMKIRTDWVFFYPLDVLTSLTTSCFLVKINLTQPALFGLALSEHLKKN